MELGVLNHSIGSASPGRGNFSTGPASPGRGPKCRIKCNGSRIQIGNREFISATEALQAYLDQYAGITINRQKYDRSVEDLLNPKSVLHMTADRSLQTGVRDTVKEMKLAETKDAITDSYDRMKASDTLREQDRYHHRRKSWKKKSKFGVEDALNRSGELLQRIVKDDDTVSPSDVGTLNTDVLLSMNPVAGYNKDLEPSQERKHIYSYRTSRTRSKTLGSVPFNKEKLDFTQDSLADNKPPVSSFRSRFRPPGSLIRERSRSEPPSTLRRGEPLVNNTQRSLLQDLDIDISKTKAPSWVEALDVANPVDSFWTKRDLMEGRPPPSWIQDMDKSDVSSMISSIGPKTDLNLNDLISCGNQNDSLMNASAQGLSYRDLVTGTPLKSKVAADLLGREKQNLDKYDLTSKLPKEVKQSGNLDLSSSDALDRYLDELGCKKLDTAEVPRCSSLDTEALIAGMCAPAGSDITGASPILKENTPVKSSPTRHRRPNTPDTDLILDGDRPWEKPAVTFKSPVFMEDPPSKIHSPKMPITDESPTLTGRQQPGSLEALKNMIFKLQCEASGGSSQGQKEKIEQILSKGGDIRAAHLEEEIPALKGYNYMDEPGGQSLEKALIHLSKLKSLVQTNQSSDVTKKQPLQGSSIT